MATEVWRQTPIFYPDNEIDIFVVMPNHIHGIIIVKNDATRKKRVSLPEIIRQYKSLTTKRYSEGVRKHGWEPFERKLWQRNYYERIIRDDREFNIMHEYIKNNPMNWENDEEYR